MVTGRRAAAIEARQGSLPADVACRDCCRHMAGPPVFRKLVSAFVVTFAGAPSIRLLGAMKAGSRWYGQPEKRADFRVDRGRLESVV